MSTPVTDYTDADAIRAAAGVSAVEWSDTQMADLNIADLLLDELDDWLTNHAAIHAAGTGSSPSIEDVQKLRLLRLYSQWFCAAKLIGLGMAWLSGIEDGKNRMERFNRLDLDKLAKRTAANAAKFRGRLLALESGKATTSTWNQFGKVSPGYDPVVGE